MDMTTALIVAVGLFTAILIPFLVWEIRSGKRRGEWLAWWKPRGHGDIGPDVGQSVPESVPERRSRQ